MTERSDEEPPERNDHDLRQWGMPDPAQAMPPPQDAPPRAAAPRAAPPHEAPPQDAAPQAQSGPEVAQHPPAPAPPGRYWPASHAPGPEGQGAPKRTNNLGLAALVLTFLGATCTLDVDLFVVGLIILGVAWLVSVASFFAKNKAMGTSIGAFFLSIGAAVLGSMFHMAQVIG